MVVPAFLPPAAPKGSLIDPPARAVSGTLDEALARAAARIDAALGSAPTLRGAPRAVQIGLFGSSLGAHSEEVREAFLALGGRYRKADGRITSLRVTLDPAHATESFLERLRAAGVGTVEIDAGSFDDDALAASALGHRAADAVEAVGVAAACGFEVGVVLRPGLPGALSGEALRSARRTVDLAPSFVRIYPVLVLADTPLARAFESRRYRPLSLEEAVPLGKELLRTFAAAGIAVARLGLQPAVDLDGGATVLAGPYHPSLRALVESSAWYDRAARLVSEHFRFQRELTFVVAPRDESRLRGLQGGNLRRLREKYRLTKIHVVVEESAEEGSLHLEVIEESGAVRKAG